MVNSKSATDRITVVGVVTFLVIALGTRNALPQIGGKRREASVDHRVEDALRQAGLKFRNDRDGDFVLSFELDNNRSHTVYIRSQTQAWGNMEIREAFAFAYQSNIRLSQANLEKMLEANSAVKSGAWQLINKQTLDGPKISALFCVKLAADCDGDALKTVVWGVARMADEMEEGLNSGRDSY